MAQQPGMGQWDTDTGVYWKSETPGVSLPAALAPTLLQQFALYALCLCLSTFSVFHYTAFPDRGTQVV